MAKRKQLFHPDVVKEKIQASQLINRLTKNALSETELMTASQVNSAKILLGKAIPDLKSVELSGDPDSPVAFVNKIELVSPDDNGSDTDT
jgi:hypothetical protein